MKHTQEGFSEPPRPWEKSSRRFFLTSCCGYYLQASIKMPSYCADFLMTDAVQIYNTFSSIYHRNFSILIQFGAILNRPTDYKKSGITPKNPIVKESPAQKNAKNGTFFTQLRSNYGQVPVSRMDTDRLVIFEQFLTQSLTAHLTADALTHAFIL